MPGSSPSATRDVREAEKQLGQLGVTIHSRSLGAYTGEFPTMIVAAVSALVGGMLGAMGQDIWIALKSYLKRRYQDLERDRQAKAHTREGRYRVVVVYITTEGEDGVPVVYYATPASGELNLEVDPQSLERAENEIRTLLKAGKLGKKTKFLGINLSNLDQGPYFCLFDSLPTEDAAILWEMMGKRREAEAEAHALVAIYFEELGMQEAANRHFEYAIAAGVNDPEAALRMHLGAIYSRAGNWTAALAHWEDAAKVNGRVHILHYNRACFHGYHGRAGEAAKELGLAVEKGYSDLDELLGDPDLAPVRGDPAVQLVIEALRRHRGN